MKKIFNLWKKYSYLFFLTYIIISPFNFKIGIAAIICMLAPIIVSIFRGRFWCGNLCPRGNFYNNIMSRFSKEKPVPKFLKTVYFRGFAVLFLFTMFGLGLKKNWGNAEGIGMVFYRIILITSILGVLLSLYYNHRIWCHFCPMGSMSSLVSYFKKNKKVFEVSNDCVGCKLCERKCPMNICPYKYKGDVLIHTDCIQCGKCAQACPKKSIGYNKKESREIKENTIY